jgi:integrase
MTISIDQRKASDGKSKFFLRFYDKSRKWTETLEVFTVDKPQTKAERESNKTAWQLVEAIRGTRLVEYQNGKYGFSDSYKQQGSFLDYFKQLTEKRKSSQGNYGNWQSTYQILLKLIDGKGLTFEEVTPEFLEKFKKYLLEAKITKSNTCLSRNSALSYFNKVKAALNQAFDDKIIQDKISLRVKGIKEEDTHREYLTLDELNKLKNTYCEIEILKKAFLFSATTGLRWSDVNNLKWKDITFSEELKCNQLRFVMKKTKAAEVLPINDQAMGFIGERMTDNERVFIGLKYSAWHNLRLQQWVMRAGINKSITFHCARHTYATLMLTHNVDIFTVSKLLGHKDIKTTQIYAKVIDQRKVDAINLFPTLTI